MLHCKNTYKLIRTRVLKKTKFHASPSRGEAERSSDEGEYKNFITLTCHKVTSSPLKGEVYFSHLLRNFNQQIFSSRIEFFIQNVIIKICNILYKMLHYFLFSNPITKKNLSNYHKSHLLLFRCILK